MAPMPRITLLRRYVQCLPRCMRLVCITTQGTLDVQYAVSITSPTPNIFYSIGGSPPFIKDYQTVNNTNEPYMDFLEFILKQPSIPQTMSVSYGDDEQTVPEDYARNVCNQFARLGAMGVSVLVASGDVGVGNATCLTNDGTNSKIFIPDFPTSCGFSPFFLLQTLTIELYGVRSLRHKRRGYIRGEP